MRGPFRKNILVLCGALAVSSCTIDDVLAPVGGSGGGTLDERVVLGLRTALSVGIDTSAAFASQLNGYLAHEAIRILLPAEAAQALKAAEEVAGYVNPFAHELQAIKSLADVTPGADQSSFTANLGRTAGVLNEVAAMGSISDSLIKYMNRAAEYAAPRSVPIFKSAIGSMTINDGLSLLNSADSTAATVYLSGKTFNPLDQAYTPIVDSTLALVPLTQYWSDFRTTYNALLADYRQLVAFQVSWNSNVVVSRVPKLRVTALKSVSYQPIQTESLGAWTTEKALTGLFFLVGEQEKSIRRDPIGYVTELAGDIATILKDVFGDIMEMQKPPNP